jgi:hypothetical protein
MRYVIKNRKYNSSFVSDYHSKTVNNYDDLVQRLKFYELSNFDIFAGGFDFRLMRRLNITQPKCLLILQDPLERFVQNLPENGRELERIPSNFSDDDKMEIIFKNHLYRRTETGDPVFNTLSEVTYHGLGERYFFDSLHRFAYSCLMISTDNDWDFIKKMLTFYQIPMEIPDREPFEFTKSFRFYIKDMVYKIKKLHPGLYHSIWRLLYSDIFAYDVLKKLMEKQHQIIEYRFLET